MNTRPEERDEDDDSLFGSPPPSPGRPPSPALALPGSGLRGSSTSTTLTQNVGTIALPGSLSDSELPINPLALSLNHGIVHRPPALPHHFQHHQPPMNSQVPVTSASLVRGGAPAAQMHAARNAAASTSTLPKKLKKRPRQSPQNDNASKPTVPEFTLPDPTGPPPTHFLRNQENLLGRAGKVAGLKPAHITHNRGSTPSNPILIEDDETDTPKLGRRVRHAEKSQPYIDPALLTAPTNQEIVSVLIGQKDIFPILEGVLKLVVGCTPAAHPQTGFEPSSSQTHSSTGPPVKKRKLNRVPAGASDWDVPYPFPQGEGPEAYHKTWERERGKQLITQLIKLIKTAATKAATKKYLAQHNAQHPDKSGKSQTRDGSEVSVDVTQAGTSRQSSCDVLQDTSNAPSQNAALNPIPTPETSSTANIPAAETQNTPISEMDPSVFDQLMSSLNDMPDQGSSQHAAHLEAFTTMDPSPFAPSNTNDAPSSAGTSTPTMGVDQPLFDTWMSFLENFPLNFDGTTNDNVNIAALTASTPVDTSVTPSLCSTPGPLDPTNIAGAEMAATASGAFSTPASDYDALLTSMFQEEPQPQSLHFDQQMINDLDFSTAPSFGDHLIDPDLLALSLDQSQRTASILPTDMNMNLHHPQAISPIGSGSSLGGSTNPSTPVSAGWDMSMPDVFVGEGADNGINAQGCYDAGLSNFGALARDVQQIANVNGKGKEKEVVSTEATNSVLHSADNLFTMLAASTATTASTPGAASLSLPAEAQAPEFISPCPKTVFPQVKTYSRTARDDIIKRAQERKRVLQAELDAVKMRLWETTIEQAGLVTLQSKLASSQNGDAVPP